MMLSSLNLFRRTTKETTCSKLVKLMDIVSDKENKITLEN